MNEATKKLGDALCKALGSDDWCTAPGGGFFVNGHGFQSVAAARKLTGIKVEPRVKRPIARDGRAGEWNAFAAIVLGASRNS